MCLHEIPLPIQFIFLRSTPLRLAISLVVKKDQSGYCENIRKKRKERCARKHSGRQILDMFFVRSSCCVRTCSQPGGERILIGGSSARRSTQLIERFFQFRSAESIPILRSNQYMLMERIIEGARAGRGLASR